MSISEQMTPAERLILLRERLEMSQRDLAREFQVSSGAIAFWEKNERPVPGPVLKLLELYENSGEGKRVSPEIDQQLKELSILLGSGEKHSENLLTQWRNYYHDHFSLNYIKGQVLTKTLAQFLRTLRNTRGATIKAAQLLSFVDIGLPAEIRRAFGDLANHSVPMSSEKVFKVIHQELGNLPTKVFKEWSDSPIAVTSMGQVHKARLHSGELVVVKVQDPDIFRILERQFRNAEWLRRLVSFFKHSNSELLEDIKEKVFAECDYTLEAENQRRFRNIFEKDSAIVIPKVYLEYSTSKVLTTEYFKGDSYEEFLKNATQGQKDEAAKTIHRFCSVSLLVHGWMHADMHPSNFRFLNSQVVFLDYGRVIEYADARRRTECRFLDAMLNGDHRKARLLLEELDSIDKPQEFNFDELWHFIDGQQIHYMTSGKFKFSRMHLSRLAQEGRRFSGRQSLKVDKWFFWAFFIQNMAAGVFADFEAENDWRSEILFVLKQALKTKS